jgi:NTP pyrophosphatase (non-canonical NTP hydrolase)
MTDGLTFRTLRDANIKRLPFFKNAKGRTAHSKPDGSDWTVSDWYMAASGEMGEFANLAKKVLRGDFTLDEVRGKLADELADVVIYVDILAFQRRRRLALHQTDAHHA